MVTKLERKRLLGRPRHSWEDNIEAKNVVNILWGENWSHLGQNGVQWGVLTSVLMNIVFCEVLGVVDLDVKTVWVNELQSSVCM